jgi:hypothetical protein
MQEAPSTIRLFSTLQSGYLSLFFPIQKGNRKKGGTQSVRVFYGCSAEKFAQKFAPPRPITMEGGEALQHLMLQASAHHAAQAAQQMVHSPLALDSALLTSPEFRMYCYKAGGGRAGLGARSGAFGALRASGLPGFRLAPLCCCRLCHAHGATGTTGEQNGSKCLPLLHPQAMTPCPALRTAGLPAHSASGWRGCLELGHVVHPQNIEAALSPLPRSPGEKATRRCPQKSNYLPIACPDMKKVGLRGAA